MTESRKTHTLILLAGMTYLLLAGELAAQATQDFGSLADNIRSQLSNFGQLAGGISALAGICMSILCLFKLRQYSQNPQDPNNRLVSALVLGIVGVTLVALPEFMDVGLVSLFGGGGSPTTTNFDGGNLFN